MTPRKKSREAALQVLFQKSFSPTATSIELFEAFKGSFELDPAVANRTLELVQGVEQHRDDLHKIVEKHSDNWRVDRIAMTDLIILELGIFELCFDNVDDTPPKMCINDYVDVAKKYSSKEAKSFINGVLDNVFHKDLSPGTDDH